MSKKKPAQGIQWDLTEIYTGIDDPQIEKDIKKVRKLISTFNKNYKGKVRAPSLTPRKLAKILKDYTVIEELAFKCGQYASLIYAKNTLDEDTGAFLQKLRELGSKISADMLWFGLERKEWSKEKADEMIKAKELSGYKHFHKFERAFIPYVLSEKEERVLSLISPVGSSAFVRLYDQMGTSMSYKIEIEGKIRKLSGAELSPYMSYHPDRSVREKTTREVIKKLEKYTMPYAFILNNLLLASNISDEMRGYKYPQEATFLSYEVNPKTVEKMVSVVEPAYDICESYYETKRKTQKLKTLHEWDRYSSIFPEVKKTFTWDETKDIVLEALYEFSSDFGDIAKEFFDSGWIDAEVKRGKVSGAHCRYGLPSDHSYILMNFNGELGDIMTLAHELGHGIHAYLSRGQTSFEFWPSTAVAEIASVFTESLVFDKLYSKLEDRKLKTNLLAAKLQDSFATVFRQVAFYLFEEDINNHRREKGELKVEDFNNYYQTRLQAMFGKSLKLTEEHKFWWMQVSHFYHYSFYVFTYAFGELLTNALYAQYKTEGKEFISRYAKALSSGGSKDPYEITKIMGVDINSDKFWKDGLRILKGYVKEFEDLTS